jgi:hypothetical protein
MCTSKKGTAPDMEKIYAFSVLIFETVHGWQACNATTTNKVET